MSADQSYSWISLPSSVQVLDRDKHRVGNLSSVYLIENFLSPEAEAEILVNLRTVTSETNLCHGPKSSPHVAVYSEAYESESKDKDESKVDELLLDEPRLDESKLDELKAEAYLQLRIPPWLNQLSAAVTSTGAFPSSSHPNHVIVNSYNPGQGIAWHRDGVNWDPYVATLSLGAGIVIDFDEGSDFIREASGETKKSDKNGVSMAFSLVLPPRSLLIFEKEAYRTYRHRIAYRDHDPLQEGMVKNWDSSHRATWLAEGWLNEQLLKDRDTDLRHSCPTLVRRYRASLLFRYMPNDMDLRKVKDRLEQSMTDGFVDADAWNSLGALGGGEVKGKKYSAAACYAKAKALDLFLYANFGGTDTVLIDGRNLSAKECLEMGLSLEPHHSGAWCELGHRGGGEIDGQMHSQKECYEKGLRCDPVYSHSWHSLGLVGGGQVNGQNYSEKECHERRVFLDPQDGHGWLRLGILGGCVVDGQEYSDKNCYEKALSVECLSHSQKTCFKEIAWSQKTCFTKGVVSDPTHSLAWSSLGQLGGGKVDGQKYSAKECFVKCLSLNPEDGEAWRHLGLHMKANENEMDVGSEKSTERDTP